MSTTEANGRLSVAREAKETLELKRVHARCRKGPPLVLALALALGVPMVGGIGIVGGWAWYHFGSRTAALAFLQGQSLLLDPQSFDLGAIRPKVKRFLTMRAVNLSSQPIAINGVQGYCTGPDGCILCTNQFPIVMQPRESHTLTLEYEFKGRPEARSIHLMTEAFTEIGNFEIALKGKIEGGEAHARP